MKRSFAVVACILVISVIAVAQMPKPAPELKKLDYFSGSWSSSGEAKPGPMGPGGKFSETGKGDWMDGNFFLVINSNFDGGQMGTAKGVAYMGYDPDEKVYTYDAFSSMGENIHAKGTVDGDTWTWNNEFKMAGQNYKSRYTMKVVSATEYTFKFDMSPDGSKWDTMMEGKATKNK